MKSIVIRRPPASVTETLSQAASACSPTTATHTGVTTSRQHNALRTPSHLQDASITASAKSKPSSAMLSTNCIDNSIKLACPFAN
jgi:hypothetical protein